MKKKTITKKQLDKVIAKEVRQALFEASAGEIKALAGKEVSMRYRKSNGEVKTYFGRVISGKGLEYLNKGLMAMGVMKTATEKGGFKLFKLDGIMAITPATLKENARAFVDEVCRKFEAGLYDAKIAEVLEGCHGGAPVLKQQYKGKQEGIGGLKEIGPDTKCPKCGRKGTLKGDFPPGSDHPSNISCTKCGHQLGEVSPPGWSGTVKAMKKHKDITNPYALAWSMKNKGAKPHYKDMK